MYSHLNLCYKYSIFLIKLIKVLNLILFVLHLSRDWLSILFLPEKPIDHHKSRFLTESHHSQGLHTWIWLLFLNQISKTSVVLLNQWHHKTIGQFATTCCRLRICVLVASRNGWSTLTLWLTSRNSARYVSVFLFKAGTRQLFALV